MQVPVGDRTTETIGARDSAPPMRTLVDEDCPACAGKGVISNRDRPDPFMVRITPFSGDEFQEQLAGLRSRALMIDAIDGKAAVFADPIKIAEELAQEVCRKRILEVHGYQGQALDDDGNPTGDPVKPKDGTELVSFILTYAWQTERKILDDIYDAIRSRSHLSAGLKKNWKPLIDSSTQDTNPSGGAAPNAPAQPTNT